MNNKKSFKASRYQGSIFIVHCSFILFLAANVFLFADLPNYRLALPKKKEKETDKKSFVFIKNVLSERNFPKLLERWSYMNESEKSNILYLSLIFKDKLSRKFVKRWLKPVLKSDYVEKELFDVLAMIFADKKICSRKLQEKLGQFNVEQSIERKYKQKCR